MRILVVEDDRKLSDILVHILEREGYEVEAVFDGVTGLHYGKSSLYDAMVLDVMLPGLSGFEVVRSLRSSEVHTPVLMLTALGALPDKIEGLDGGADQYLTKPFSPQELLARLRALTRRIGEAPVERIDRGGTLLDGATYSLSCEGETIQLSDQEYLMARLLFQNPGRVLTRKQIAEGAWEPGVAVEDHSIDAYVSLLRKKLRFLHSEVRIETERGVGYRLVP